MIATIVVTIVLVAEGSAKTVVDAFGFASPVCFALGGMIPGFTHIDVVFAKLKFLLIIPVAGWMLFLIFILGVPMFGGWIFMLFDFVKFMKIKKQDKASGAKAAPAYTQTIDVQ